MSYTKREFIDLALEEIGLAGYEFDIQPEQLNLALRKLDNQMAKWNGLGISLGYPLPSSPNNSKLNDDTNVPDSANEAVYKNLAIAMAPSFGKTVSAETRQGAREGYLVLLTRAVQPNEFQMPASVPIGAGNRWRRVYRPFSQTPQDNTVSGPDTTVTFEP